MPASRTTAIPNSGDLVREFEVSAATAHRDIAYLRDRLLAPLDFSQRKNGYYYTNTDFRLPFEDMPGLVLLLGMLQKMAGETGLTDLPELQTAAEETDLDRLPGPPVHR